VHEAASPTEELTNLIARQSLIPLLGGILLRLSQASQECMIFPHLVIFNVIFLTPTNSSILVASYDPTQTHLHMHLTILPRTHVSLVCPCPSHTSLLALVANSEKNAAFRLGGVHETPRRVGHPRSCDGSAGSYRAKEARSRRW
jgi:hypothetical protein